MDQKRKPMPADVKMEQSMGKHIDVIKDSISKEYMMSNTIDFYLGLDDADCTPDDDVPEISDADIEVYL